MITNKDLDIQNISYTNKDFGQIYPELVELAKKLTNKWDPEETNESDPGIVLLKLAAFLGDKLNYNIDKNTLEQFIVSATQEKSMRRLTEMMGYNMKYYNSATTEIGFRYLGKMKAANESTDETADTNSIENLSEFFIKAFDTEIKTEDDIIYTLLEDIQITNSVRQATKKLAIQGHLKELTVLGSDNYTDSDLIQLYNLDDQNRIYFPDTDVAENGIFINREVYSLLHPDYWHKVDNLNDKDLGSKIFKFGYDSDKGFPYIEFPSDIADLIGDGLKISYIVSSGLNGKVLANRLTKFSKVNVTKNQSDTSAFVTEIKEDSYVLSNSVSVAGSNPETITEAYNNFKKTIGTFNTLVSCKDYSNYLNLYTDNNNKKLVSNVCVTDVRTDPDYSKVIFSRDGTQGSHYRNETTINGDKYPYNLIMHGTLPVNQDITSISLYNKTYNSLTKSDIYDIDNAIDDVKSINHNIVKPNNDQINFIEADYLLKANITTKYKVNNIEQKDIINNIKLALSKNFNANKVDFGEEIPYTSLINCIQNADNRIKNTSLDDPKITFNLKYPDNTVKEFTLIDGNQLNSIITENIVAGNLPVYKEIDDFNYDCLMEAYKKVDNIAAVFGEYKLTLTDTETSPTKLKENESIQIIRDSYLTDLIYPAYIYYAFIGTNEPGNIAIPKNTVYRLKENETLYIQYTDSSDVLQFVKYEKGATIKANFDIVNTNGLATILSTEATVDNKVASKFIRNSDKQIMDKDVYTYSKWQNNTVPSKDGITPLFSIGTKEEIDILRKNEASVKKNTNIFWYIKPRVVKNGNNFEINNSRGDLILKVNPWNNNQYFYILEEGEYIVYPNDDLTSLNILQSGSKITVEKLPDDTEDTLIIRRNREDVIDLNSLENAMETNDVGTFKQSFNWEIVDREIKINETAISNYIEGTTLKSNAGAISIDKNWAKCSSDLLIDGNKLFNGEDIDEPIIRTVLSINASKENNQIVKENQTIIALVSDIQKETETQLATITFKKISINNLFQIYPEIDSYNDLCVLCSTQYYEDSEGYLKPKQTTDGKYLYEFNASLIHYKEQTTNQGPATIQTLTLRKIGDLLLFLKGKNKLVVNDRDEYVINGEDLKEFDSTLSILIVANEVDLSAAELAELKNNSNLYYNVYNYIVDSAGTLINASGTSLMKNATVLCNLDNLKEADLKSSYIYISKPKNLDLYNYLKENNISEEMIQKSIEGNTDFDWLGERNSSKLITSYQPLYSFFDPNNIYNKLTLAKIDFDKSEFNIVGSSRV